MARTTAVFTPRTFSIWLVGTEAATEITSCPGETCGRISSRTSCTVCGFTQMKMMSAPCTALALSVPTSMPRFSARRNARSECRTVARVNSFESNTSRSSACKIIPPSFPAPRTATFLSAKVVAIETLPFAVRVLIPFHCVAQNTSFGEGLHHIGRGVRGGESDMGTDETAQSRSKVAAIGGPEIVKGLLEGLENWVANGFQNPLAVEMAGTGGFRR